VKELIVYLLLQQDVGVTKQHNTVNSETSSRHSSLHSGPSNTGKHHQAKTFFLTTIPYQRPIISPAMAASLLLLTLRLSGGLPTLQCTNYGRK
jgi:hypothetical protein